MFGWFKSKAKGLKGDWRSSKAHLSLLSKFSNPQDAGAFFNNSRWTQALGQSPQKALKTFRADGVLRSCELNELLEAKFTGADLKKMLSAEGLKVSGRKADQAMRLVEHDPSAARSALGDFSAMRCTEEGEQVVHEFLEQQTRDQLEAEESTLAKLRDKKLRAAALIVKDYEASQVFSRGLGIDWNSTDMAREIDKLEVIFSSAPAILGDLDPDVLSELRIAGGMMELWGTKKASQWFQRDFETGSSLSLDVAARMLVFAATHKMDLADAKRIKAKSIEIMGANDQNQCEACKSIDGKKFSLKKVPELPLAECTCVMGCRCGYLLHD